MQATQILFLARELRSEMLWGQLSPQAIAKMQCDEKKKVEIKTKNWTSLVV